MEQAHHRAAGDWLRVAGISQSRHLVSDHHLCRMRTTATRSWGGTQAGPGLAIRKEGKECVPRVWETPMMRAWPAQGECLTPEGRRSPETRQASELPQLVSSRALPWRVSASVVTPRQPSQELLPGCYQPKRNQAQPRRYSSPHSSSRLGPRLSRDAIPTHSGNRTRTSSPGLHFLELTTRLLLPGGGGSTSWRMRGSRQPHLDRRSRVRPNPIQPNLF